MTTTSFLKSKKSTQQPPSRHRLVSSNSWLALLMITKVGAPVGLGSTPKAMLACRLMIRVKLMRIWLWTTVLSESLRKVQT